MAIAKVELVSAEEVLRLWSPKARPSIQWLRQHRKDIQPIRVGRFYYYNLDKVRAALSANLVS
jgi:hypothetical protein